MGSTTLQAEHFCNVLESHAVGITVDKEDRRFRVFEFLGSKVEWRDSYLSDRASRRGASSALLLQMLDRMFVPAISVPLFVEYEATLLREENLLDRDAATVESFLDSLLSVSHLQDVFFAWRSALPDPDDDFILELAVAADCRYIVTHNVRIFADQSNGESWPSLRLTSSNLLRHHKHEHRNHSNA